MQTEGGLLRLLSAACVAVVLLPLLAGVAASQEQELRNVNDRLEDAREGLELLDSQREQLLARVRDLDRRLAEIDGKLGLLRAELAEAEAALRAAEVALARATQTLVAKEAQLLATRQELTHNRDVFRSRTRTVYMHGALDIGSGMLAAGSPSDAVRAVEYMQHVAEADRERVEVVDALERQEAEEAGQLEVLQRQRAAHRGAAERERNRVSRLVGDQQRLRDEQDAELAEHQRLLKQVEADRRGSAELVAALERESERLEAELRRAAERARQAAQRRRQQSGSAPAPAPEGQFHRPSNGPVTSSYGWRTHPISGRRKFHSGVDFGAPMGAPVWAAEDGVVYSAGWRGGYGKAVVLDHGGGLTTLYAHMSVLHVVPGQRVSGGERIGSVGTTGYSTGPHLHFEVRVHGETRDPMNYL